MLCWPKPCLPFHHIAIFIRTADFFLQLEIRLPEFIFNCFDPMGRISNIIRGTKRIFYAEALLTILPQHMIRNTLEWRK